MLTVSAIPAAPDPQLAFRSTVRDLAVTLAELSLSLGSLAAAAANPSGASPTARLAYATAEMLRLAGAAHGLAVALLIAADFATLPALPAEVD